MRHYQSMAQFRRVHTAAVCGVAFAAVALLGCGGRSVDAPTSTADASGEGAGSSSGSGSDSGVDSGGSLGVRVVGGDLGGYLFLRKEPRLGDACALSRRSRMRSRSRSRNRCAVQAPRATQSMLGPWPT
jgi:hypothetical protein